MHDKTLTELKAGLQAKDFSARELTEHFLDRVQARDGELNSFVTVTGEQALAQADAADQAIAAGDHRLLTGLPIAHKDIFCTEGVRTSCGSRMLDNFVAPYTATAVERMAAQGAVMLGKTNMDEFAMGSSNETSFYGPVRNPWDTERVPGGSSGGAAACLAARLAPGATGTDTGGSIRQPAALNGVTGLKPTYGRVSRWGMIAFASSLDQAGPLGLSAADCALMLQAMAGHDDKDSTCLDEPVGDYLGALDQGLDGLRIGVPEEFFPDDLDGAIADNAREAMRELEKQGAKLVKVSLPSIKLSVPAYYVIAPAEASSNLSRFDGVRFGYRCEDPKDLEDLYKRSRSEGFGAEVKRRILVGTYALSAGYYDAYYKRAQRVRRLIRDDFARAFKEVDVLMGPTSPETAFKLGAKADDPVKMYMADVFTIAVNLAGLPALSMPSGFVDGLPAGTQVIGNYFQEGRILNVAHRYQMATDWHQRIPGAFQ
ncbi:Asp-tRNA(Asn)/Glu-tRNA(Gln) amidotransferase subunit GatA [Alloalcanivorax profundimaris]|uniref:Asp-tRNA(Asn)/Glu-tRNA(Gln) amidotransferase subunit GatA n=1 Tax=Alloalcanivorax profundimaris TaxID=2735259 RepID=UPI000C5EC835|nr:Asp-tRNA(Asn)/Glu-tRNA(Gln) amidotransferase subunit GatA [Alloalcanivorax profundimaris]MAO58558.1 Asp-tRNA(Asn)/Glu-tRNA(Gln) amidotransferase GatCAB subunit A [Alcanivorax sp.]MCQ6262510.1 Asp-tRNA(Asn)/Glu-tRNA(Gln) amidotransferase subunit GatA [Alcanivorax sp. MM125-6]MAY09725.1 Asp-tRNA(Asn)/Glu-tRNA(Gln) amidotransferase GatCAB subunit A [Alcanivorax sp.]MBF1800674.1 Asp-tRNA(Asn)/Glu-tRNA(Gln) amidotransferase subunit GatA [Alloalcanivorax profundimaris]MBI56020.1 Asp-tRNA(Asn)/Glu|tara:strand:- start:8008 stop:9462 length:1455 start_codon:yes stop_codon:yes gene_type:complete